MTDTDQRQLDTYVLALVNPDTGKQHMKPTTSQFSVCGKRARWIPPDAPQLHGERAALQELEAFRWLSCKVCIRSLSASIAWPRKW